jgi:hypothetical protein
MPEDSGAVSNYDEATLVRMLVHLRRCSIIALCEQPEEGTGS